MLRMARWGQPAAAGVIPCSPRLTQEGRASLPAPKLAMRSVLDVEHGNDLERARIHHDDLIVDQEHLVAAPVRVDVDDFHRKRVERHLARNTGTDRDREIDVGHRPDVLLLDHGADLGALFGRELCAGAGLSDGLGPAFRALCLGVHVALAVFSAFSLRAGAVLTTFGLEVLSPLGVVVLGTHALRLFALHVGVLGRSFALRSGLDVVLRAQVWSVAQTAWPSCQTTAWSVLLHRAQRARPKAQRARMVARSAAPGIPPTAPRGPFRSPARWRTRCRRSAPPRPPTS